MVDGKCSDWSLWCDIVERIFMIIKLFFDNTQRVVIENATTEQNNISRLGLISLLYLNELLFLLLFLAVWCLKNIIMRIDGHRSKLQAVKYQLFDFIFILDASQLTNPIFQIAMILLQLSFLHYFYINSIFPFLNDHRTFRAYFQNFQNYFIHINAFNSSTLALLILSIYPIVILVTLVIKRLGPNKIFRPIVQIAIYIYPLLQIKIAIQFISACALGKYLYLVVPLGIFSFAFGGLLMVISNKSYRVVEYPLILMLELKANIYLLLISLAIRLCVTCYLLYPTHRYLLGFFYECSLFAILLASKFCDDQFLNYVGFLFLVITCLAIGAKSLQTNFALERTILDYADQLENEENEGSIYEVYRRIQMHYVDCNILDCRCQHFYEIGREGLAEWVYKFQEERLRRRENFEGRYEYAVKCQSHYEFRLSGLVRICEGKANSLMEEYKIFKVCSLYQMNLRKQDKNYRYGEPYENAQEEFQTFQLEVSKILRQIRTFWTLITNFDGSTKFLSQILLISRAITNLNKKYELYESKYDEELRQFKYTYQIFLSIILNEQIVEQDEVIVPQPTSFLITNGQKILNANNSFLVFSSQSRDKLLGSSYNSLIPDVYKDIHCKWAGQFIERIEDYEGKSITKCLSVGNIEIKMVEMQHKVLPRFLQGLQIYTTVKPAISHRKQKRDSFIFLVEKDTFFIKNVQSSFFDVIKFKVNQRNFKMLQEMSLTSIFENFTIIHSQNPTRQVTIFPHFLQEFTRLKAKKKTHKKSKTTNTINPRNSYLASQQSRANSFGQNQQIFDFTILPSLRKEDPYAKVQFTLKEDKQEDVVSSQEGASSSHNYEGQQPNHQHRPKKQDNFGFYIPYYLVATLGLCHIFFALGKNNFNNALLDLHNRYEFYQHFDYTTLYVLNAWIGVDKTQELRTLWIDGYGDFSESFNAFRRANDPYFLNYFNTQISANFHNQLYIKTEALISGSLNLMNIYQISILIIISLAIGHYVFDLILSLRYTFFIESKVGAMLLQFVIIQSRDVREILSMISSFEENVLNIQQEHKSSKVPVETVEESALQLMKGGGISLNNSMALQNEQDQEVTIEKKNSYRKKGSSYEERERVSLSMMKYEFKSSDKRSGFKKQAGIKEEYNNDKNRNINLFKKKYRNFGFIISANKFLYFLIFSGFLINIGIVSSSISAMYTPFNYLPLHLQILDSLQESRVILLKSQTEILTNQTLSPNFSISTSLLSIINLMNSISGNSATSNFNAKLTSYLTSDVCSTVNFNCSLLAGDNNLHKYGMKVIVQYIEDYLRMKNSSLIKTKNLQNQLIAYTQVLYTNLIEEFMIDSQDFCDTIQRSELKMLIIGSIGLLFGMFLVHYSLREFKNRIENSQNLLKIIPKEIKKKQEKDIEELTLKELSTP